mmetsp:Transcript_35181/g.76906  ORF Transcript_35181/g.76906 Transcript_35181/m.76906 type:complete len:286 (-) Transcript_35181:559-1416(-)
MPKAQHIPREYIQLRRIVIIMYQGLSRSFRPFARTADLVSTQVRWRDLHLDHELALVAPVVKHVHHVDVALKPLLDVQLVLDLPIGNPLLHHFEHLAHAGELIDADEALHGQPAHEDHVVVLHPDLVCVVLVDQPAEGDAAVVVELEEHLLQHGPRGVVEVAINAVRRQLLQLGRHVVRLVVDDAIKPQLLGEPVGLLLRSDGANDPGARHLRQLARHGPHRPRRARHDEGLPGLGGADLGCAVERGQADYHGVRTQLLGRGQRGVGLVQRGAVGNEVVLATANA